MAPKQDLNESLNIVPPAALVLPIAVSVLISSLPEDDKLHFRILIVGRCSLGEIHNCISLSDMHQVYRAVHICSIMHIGFQWSLSLTSVSFPGVPYDYPRIYNMYNPFESLLVGMQPSFHKICLEKSNLGSCPSKMVAYLCQRALISAQCRNK